MALSKYLTLDLSAKNDVVVEKHDLVYPLNLDYKKWTFEVPTLEAVPLKSERRLLVKVGDQEIALKGATTIKVMDAISKQEVSSLVVPESLYGPRSVSCEELMQTFLHLYPWLESLDFNNLMIAGGSLATILQLLSTNRSVTLEDINDIDFFLHGMDSVTGLAKVESLITKIKSLYPDSTCIRTQCAVTLIDKAGINKFQIIMSMFNNPSQVLHSFDFGASKVGIVKQDNILKVVTTQLGRFCLENRINIVDHHANSNTYNQRLVKYFKRGFSVVFKDLDIKAIRPGRVVFPYIVLDLDSVSKNHMKGTVSVVKSDNKGTTYDGGLNMKEILKEPSDETSHPKKIQAYDAGFNFKKLHSNKYFDTTEYVHRFMSGDPIFVTKVNACDFTTGAEALSKSSMIPKVSTKNFVKYVPDIYSDDKLDLKIFEKIPEFDYSVFMKCRRKGPAYLNSYLFSIYYGVEALKLVDTFNKAYGRLSASEIERYGAGSFLFSMRNISTTKKEWYGDFLKPDGQEESD
jgi:hypothetical protein